MKATWVAAIAVPFFLLLLILPIARGGSMGVNYGRLGDNLPSPSQVVSLLQSNNIQKARIFDADKSVMEAFKGTNIDLSIAITNQELQNIASSADAAKQWVSTNLISFPTVIISTVAVGNEVLTNNQIYTPYLMPALNNLYTALQSYNLHNTTKLSTPHAFNVLSSTSFPPSAATFNDTSSMKPILDFLSTTSAPFLINVYPFFSYSGDTKNIPIEYATFDPSATGVTDSATGLHYTNLYDAMIDTVVTAIAALGYNENIPIVVTETGWPSLGDEAGATKENAQRYNTNLIKHIQSGVGTPKIPNAAPDAYIFALFNENQKSGPTSERNFGLFQPNQAHVYNISLSGQ